MSIDFTKPVQTRDGRKVRILCTDSAVNGWPVVGIVESSSSMLAMVYQWRLDGTCDFGRHSHTDLINVPPLKKKALVTVRLYRCPQVGVYPAVSMEGQPAPWGSDFIAQQFVEMEYTDDNQT